MKISGCGYACEICHVRTTKACKGCSPENPMAKNCKIFACLSKEKKSTCLECERHLSCHIYSDTLRHCPLRISILYGYDEKSQERK